MKKFTFLLAVSILLSTTQVNAQEDAERECKIKYNLFKGDYQSKKYDDAYPNWMYLMDNCKDLSVNIYKLGVTMAQDFKKDPALAKRVFEQRLEYFPDDNPAKVYSEYATYLSENKLATDNEIFVYLEKAYEISPQDMGVVNIYKYFEGITEQYKDTNPQKVFDTYDDVIESVAVKLADYAKKIADIKGTDSTKVLDRKEERYIQIYSTNSTALGQIEGGLDAMMSELATCERLIPLYERDLEKNRNNEVWLQRAVSRMFYKGCQEDPLYEKLARAYAEASPSPEAYSFLSTVLEGKGDESGAAEMKRKAFDLETDPLKKATYKLKFAQAAQERGQLSKARGLAREALSYNPNNGKAYLLIARLYASSVNSCGDDEFEKRMVYVAALNQAQRAAAVDPSIAVTAGKYIRSYSANVPDKKMIFTKGVKPGSSYAIKCWIGETVRVPSFN